MPKKKKTINMSSKSAKYFINHNLKGMNKTKAAKEAGISDPRNVTNIEKTNVYQDLAVKYADVIGGQITMDETVAELIKNVRQDDDKGAKNNALKMLMERVEPETLKREEEDKLVVILR